MTKNPYGEDPSVAGLFKFLRRTEEEPVEDEFKGWPAAGPPEGR